MIRFRKIILLCRIFWIKCSLEQYQHFMLISEYKVIQNVRKSAVKTAYEINSIRVKEFYDILCFFFVGFDEMWKKSFQNHFRLAKHFLFDEHVKRFRLHLYKARLDKTHQEQCVRDSCLHVHTKTVLWILLSVKTRSERSEEKKHKSGNKLFAIWPRHVKFKMCLSFIKRKEYFLF